MIQARKQWAAWLFVGALGCGRSTTGAAGNSTSGSVEGVSLSVESALAVVGQGSILSGCYGQTCYPVGDTVTVVLTNAAAFTCSTLASQPNVSFANLAGLTLEVGNATPVGPGTYAIDDALGDAGAWPLAAAWFASSTADCGAGLSARATGGTITLTTASASHVAGTFTATFDQGTLSGSFDVDVCSPSDASPQPVEAGAPRCVP